MGPFALSPSTSFRRAFDQRVLSEIDGLTTNEINHFCSS